MPIPDLHISTTQFFFLARQASRLSDWSGRLFWQISASLVPTLAAHLPALATGVSNEDDIDDLRELARHPLPSTIPAETVFWHEHLVATWERKRTSSFTWFYPPVLLALVRLDSCGMPQGMQRPSRLPEWLAEARQIAGAGSEPASTGPAHAREKLEALAALAEWRPAPGVITSEETLREWAVFWQQMRQSKFLLVKGIAAKALLNLSETDLRTASIPTAPAEELLRDLARAIPVAAKKTEERMFDDYLLLLDWQPAEPGSLPGVELAAVARGWLEVARHGDWKCRRAAWRQLFQWDRTGSLNACRIELLPVLVQNVPMENNDEVLWELARWTPVAAPPGRAGNGSDFALFQELESHWQRQRSSADWLVRRAGWMGGFCLRQTGWASESPKAFLKAYLSAVRKERDTDVLFVLAQWLPGPDMSREADQKWKQVWQYRLRGKNWYLSQVAGFAVLYQALERGIGGGLRRAALGAWRTKTKAVEPLGEPMDEVTGFLLPVVYHFHEARARVSAGGVLDFEKEPAPPAQRQYPRLALPPGHIAEGEWRMDNGKLKMENDGAGLKPGSCPTPDAPSR